MVARRPNLGRGRSDCRGASGARGSVSIPGLVRTYLASLILHAIGTVAVMRVAAWLFDSQRDGFRRPLKSLWGGPARVDRPRTWNRKNRTASGR